MIWTLIGSLLATSLFGWYLLVRMLVYRLTSMSQATVVDYLAALGVGASIYCVVFSATKLLTAG